MLLHEAVHKLYSDSSKATIKKWIIHDRILVDGHICNKPHTQVNDNQTIELSDTRHHISHDLKILYQDDSVVVVYKPQGLLSVAHETKLIPNVHDLLKRQLSPSRVFPVHRLDRDTSGILVFALTKEARDHLKQQFFDHSITRRYIALVEGKVKENGTWKSHLIEDRELRVKSDPKGKLAITHYEIVKQNDQMSLLRITLETGRKNQIRVHASEANHPIVGDRKYDAKRNPIKRLGLHAEHLAFTHPVTNQRKAIHFPHDRSFDLFD